MPAQRTVRTSWHARNAFSPRSERFLTKLFEQGFPSPAGSHLTADSIASDPSFALSIRWDSSGKSIILHHLPELAEICKTRFNCTTLESFEGNFRRYGFKSRRESPNGTMITTWTHPVLNRFYRGDLELISRKEAKNPYSLTESESRSKSELECQSYSSSECQPRAADIYIDHVDICFLQILYRIASTQKNKNIIYWETNTSPSRMVLRNLEKTSSTGESFGMLFCRRILCDFEAVWVRNHLEALSNDHKDPQSRISDSPHFHALIPHRTMLPLQLDDGHGRVDLLQRLSVLSELWAFGACAWKGKGGWKGWREDM
ncbi:hypothetical protein C8F01DRAFT_1112244, partial [Mycena amicta]